MLLLSSATRILATGTSSNAPTHNRAATQNTAASLNYWSIGRGKRQRKLVIRVSEGNMPLLAQASACGIEAAAENYQGMIFFSPFFFLLVDSFWGSAVLVLSAGFAFGSAAAVVPLPVAPVVSVPAVAAGGLDVSVLAAGGFSAAGGAVPLVSPVVSPVAAGAAPLPVSPLSTVEPPDAPLCGVATSTTAVLPVAPLPPPAPSCVLPPPLRMSTALVVSVSGSICGLPNCEEFRSSFSGPFLTKLIGLLSMPGFGRGALTSACIHASAFGSACGTGTWNATSLPFASPTLDESGYSLTMRE